VWLADHSLIVVHPVRRRSINRPRATKVFPEREPPFGDGALEQPNSDWEAAWSFRGPCRTVAAVSGCRDFQANGMTGERLLTRKNRHDSLFTVKRRMDNFTVRF
jgi:hypothetical protein